MPDRNLYAIQPRGLEERARADHSVVAAARRNVSAVRAVQPAGPYVLGGYSYGGIVAFEMACRLRSLGEEVALLVVIDTAAPIGGSTAVHRVRARADALRADTPPSPVRRAGVVAARSLRFAAQSAYAHAKRRIVLSSAGLVPRSGWEQYRLFRNLNLLMGREYRATRTFDGRMLVLRGLHGDVPTEAGIYSLSDLGWSKFVSGPIDVEEVTSDHLGLVRRPAVEQVGRYLDRALG
jgi:thioesterase domain-containing protein